MKSPGIIFGVLPVFEMRERSGSHVCRTLCREFLYSVSLLFAAALGVMLGCFFVCLFYALLVLSHRGETTTPPMVFSVHASFCLTRYTVWCIMCV